MSLILGGDPGESASAELLLLEFFHLNRVGRMGIVDPLRKGNSIELLRNATVLICCGTPRYWFVAARNMREGLAGWHFDGLGWSRLNNVEVGNRAFLRERE